LDWTDEVTEQQTYSPYDYFGEFGQMVEAVNADANIPNKGLLIGPNLATGWTPQQIWDTGFIDSYTNSLAYLAFERRVLVLFFPNYQD
jgi:hypothetical protein